MIPIPAGTEITRPFLPAQDFELSKRFYETLGFEKVLDGEVAIFRVGQGEFVLQRFYRKELAENLMMQLVVDDLDAWWAHISERKLVEKFGIILLQAPTVQPWGLRVAYLADPSGILWHLVQRSETALDEREPLQP